MRTTLTLDEDIAAKLAEASRKTGQPFKQVVNSVLRRGLHGDAGSAEVSRLCHTPQKMGMLKPGFTLDKISAVLDEADGAPQR